MKTKTNIFIAFLLNLLFSIFEFFGGLFTGSIAILSDAVHDFGDAISIGSSLALEKISEKKPNNLYSYGYRRFSVLGGLITTLILIVSSCFVFYNAILRIISPVAINYDGMIIFAIVGFIINLIATYFTNGGNSINQKAVNLHMLEDVLGWLVVLIGAIVIRFTHFYILDPILSVIVALIIIVNSIKNLIQITNIFLMQVPKNINLLKLNSQVKNIEGVIDAYHFHVWSIDGQINCATIHVLMNEYDNKVKQVIKDKFLEHGISHCTIEIETINDPYLDKKCNIQHCKSHQCLHHHHH